jgi:hypothetical protein
MAAYRFFQIVSGEGRTEAEVRDFVDDLDALDYAERLAKMVPIEIWDGTRMVARVKPGERAAGPS